eukprot:TRINITY_DN913_c0_g1_i2.p1 TRINITY_DN913_c0_g1~~TRINITY_DN913_c0_g1_i2.p1  ORF type:complete len:374 (+),score=42.53 TRINITY_DN913_c0_g1_i2:25-1122(+)
MARYGVIFSGIQPSGALHIGNYLGAIRNWVWLQAHAGQVLFSVVDLHAITSATYDPATFRQRTRSMTAGLLACGIDPQKSILFQQSAVSGHSELAWILGCNTSFGALTRMTQFKSKVTSGFSKETLGLFSYPVLQAADILLYKGTHVPVGNDQQQHLELARDIAQSFNRRFKTNCFPVPAIPRLDNSMERVMSLKDGTVKMSKSDPAVSSRIELTDSADVIARKIQKATTSSHAILSYAFFLFIVQHALFCHQFATNSARVSHYRYDEVNSPSVANLLRLYSAMTGQTLEAVQADTSLLTQGHGHFKSALTQILVETVCPIGKEIARLERDPEHLDAVLCSGAERARAIAAKTMHEVHSLLGFYI